MATPKKKRDRAPIQRIVMTQQQVAVAARLGLTAEDYAKEFLSVQRQEVEKKKKAREKLLRQINSPVSLGKNEWFYGFKNYLLVYSDVWAGGRYVATSSVKIPWSKIMKMRKLLDNYHRKVK